LAIREYLEENILLLTVSSVIEHFQIVTRREMEIDGYLRMRAVLIDGGLLAVSIYCQLVEDTVELVGYRFHWQDRERELIKRWDNARHHPELKTFPHHMHTGGDEKVRESASVTLSEVLRGIESEIGKG